MGCATRRPWITRLGQVARLSVHEPIIVILFLAGVFTVISGSYVHGALLLGVATVLTWDEMRGRDRQGPPSGATAAAGAGPAGEMAGRLPGTPAAARRRPVLVIVAVTAGSALYAIAAGSFIRYSWPATVAVAGLAAAVVAIGWRGPPRARRDPGKLPARGAALWAGLLVAAGGWELVAYFQQPSLTAISYQHPTISALTDPLLISHLGRSAALAIWLVTGWFLVQR